ncbi:HNH endonuclease [Candidatus Planktophila versatilis]|uniref:HNH endonuclease n=1 Tax=Candidatus Planktophila versatilis TaxID=1884905 RepID=A0AAC9YWE3_9ACTN|nr:HNH endonuclease family protein [Candidatus Planktophila versatilis]ASY18828.1 HNH endonuclease [Candidatus Planktophila versatilis]ASY22844.1 HNH endonuclease [Candidatus Planktophila versatilis]
MSRWEIQIALMISAGVLAISIPPASAAESAPGVALAVLETLPVKGRAPKTGYSRAAFGQSWADVDRNGCDTRNDILKRDMTSIVFKPKTRNCVVLSGILTDRYSGEMIDFVRGNVSSMEVQIDHVVALSNSWQTGAFKLSIAQRTALANDPLNLFAVKGRLNLQKSDGDAATWVPPLKSFRCAYVAQQIAVKAKYELWVVAPEKAAMSAILAQCPTQQVPVS